MKVLVTGAAGFIGMHLCQALLEAGEEVVGLDNLNDYYAVSLKHARLAHISHHSHFRFVQQDIVDGPALLALFAQNSFDIVVHLAAQAGVGYSKTNPQAYVQSNLIGFANVLEACRQHQPQHFLFASTSSVYGFNERPPFTETDCTDYPVSFYAATKKANEVMAHSYAHLYGIPSTGLRFFTVYGPWGRPDMAPWLFTEAITRGEPIKLFNHGQSKRDFTEVSDIVRGIVKLLAQAPAKAGPDGVCRHPRSHPWADCHQKI
jgi:UDP-glucuronate 4-epimerase